MVFAREFFDLQFSFAERVRALSGMPLERALLEYTSFYVRFGLGRDFEADHPTWQVYLAGLRDAEDRRDWTYRFYLKDAEASTAPSLIASFGCFSYALPDAGRVRLHFRNAEPDGTSPLGAQRLGQRRADLAALFQHLSRTIGGNPLVVGVSWLYNLDAYCRLFPPEYTASVRVVRGVFRSMPLWGQFLDHRGDVKQAMTQPFLKSIAQCSDVAQLDECFPFPILTAQAPARQFNDYYRSGDSDTRRVGPQATRSRRN